MGQAPSLALQRCRRIQAFKYANRYGYPDGGIVAEIAKHHGVKTENVMIAAGSGEILDVVGTTFLQGGKKVVGVEPSYTSVYQHATSIRADAIRIPLLEDYTQDIPAIIKATRTHYRDVGFVYLCNPNNPTARVVTSRESQTAARWNPGRHAGAHRRGVSPLRG